MDWRYVLDKNVFPLKNKVLLFIDRIEVHQKISKTFSLFYCNDSKILQVECHQQYFLKHLLPAFHFRCIKSR